ncbi:MAG: efflux transporter outer membrane subunit [Sandaracinaceae bacterium]
MMRAGNRLARGLSWLGPMVAASLTPGCLPHTPQTNPEPPVGELPESFRQAAGGEAPLGDSTLASPDRWWIAFEDPELTALIDRAMARNFDMRAAWARLDQAEAVAEGASADFWPQVSLSLDVSRRRQVAVFGALGTQEFEFNNFGLSVPVTYELDVWNRIGAQVAAAGLDVLASRDDVEALAITVAANVTERFLDVLFQRAARQLLTEQLDANQVQEELLVLRFGLGLGTTLDIYQQRQQVEAVEAQLATIDAQEAVARQQLAVLVGEMPGTFAERIGRLDEPSRLPRFPALPATGIPSMLLARRPDVRAAQRRAAAADWRLGSAIAAQFPAFRFDGSFGLNSPTLEGFVSSFVFSVAAGILTPVLDGGRLAAEARRNRALVQERLQQFAQTLLTAILEVENALALERQQLVNITNLEDQLDNARAQLRESRRRYAEGLSDYLPVITALVTVQSVEQSLLTARREALSQRVQLVRALGGAWTAELEAPAFDEAPQDVARGEEEEP